MNLLSLISNLVIFMLMVISKHVLNIGSFDPNPIRKIHDMIWILSPTYCRQLASMEDLPISSETLISESDSDPPSTCPQGSPEHPAACLAESKPTELLRALEVVERDSVAIAESFTSLFASLRLALSEVSFGIVEIVGDCERRIRVFDYWFAVLLDCLVTSSSVDHMRCFNDAAGRLQESALDAATRGNRYINSCLRLNEEMKGVDGLAMQLYPFNLVWCMAMHFFFSFVVGSEVFVQLPSLVGRQPDPRWATKPVGGP
ncbi:hypothetical protein CK203_067708 [Vitis vinifera]|uniref:Uncharacterized protein n=1 Tax=Vitis vinifera TaxID=29760 RepID=A0A438BZG5_VITVI|nr:hypothetical protein CK203_067708 [Vitis vinifera]